MTTLAIDPSLSATGLAVLDLTGSRPVLRASACVKPPASLADQSPTTRARYIAQVVASWIDTYQPDLVAIEEPPAKVRPVAYQRADGSRGTRVLVSPGQHRLIGQIEGVCMIRGARIALVSPDAAKQAVGLPARSNAKPVSEVVYLLGHQLAGPKYAQEAIADAIAVAIAAERLVCSQTRQAAAGELGRSQK